MARRALVLAPGRGAAEGVEPSAERRREFDGGRDVDGVDDERRDPDGSHAAAGAVGGREAAALAESTQARLSDIEAGKTDMKLSNLVRWAKALGYDLQLSFVPIEEQP